MACYIVLVTYLPTLFFALTQSSPVGSPVSSPAPPSADSQSAGLAAVGDVAGTLILYVLEPWQGIFLNMEGHCSPSPWEL